MSERTQLSFATSIDYAEVAILNDRLRKIPAEFKREARGLLRAAGQTVLGDAKQRASAFSTRIPGALSLRVTTTGKRPGVAVVASLKKAPIARAMEGFLDPSWKHPVFGDRNWWVEQDAHPYLWPAMQAAGAQLSQDIKDVINDVHRRAGLI